MNDWISDYFTCIYSICLIHHLCLCQTSNFILSFNMHYDTMLEFVIPVQYIAKGI